MDRIGDSFSRFVVDSRPSLLRTAHLQCGDHAEAEELVQTTLLMPSSAGIAYSAATGCSAAGCSRPPR